MERREFIEPMHFRLTVEEVSSRWSDAPLRFVRNFENAVYEIGTSPASYLRMTPTTHHASDEVASELDFALFLGASGVAVAQPVPARDGTLFCTAEVDGVEYTACVFEQAPGRAYDDHPDLDPTRFFFNAGRLMAEVHEAGTHYEPSRDFRRFSWREDRWHRFEELVPQREVQAWRLYEELMTWTSSLPTDSAYFGMIHGDFTIANLRIDQGRVTLFDLDSCCQHWHTYEVAMFLHFFGAHLT